MIKKYKLTNQDLTTHNGFKWGVGEMESIPADSFYDSPLVALLMNYNYDNTDSPRLWEVEIDAVVAHDGVMGRCHELTLVRELSLPIITNVNRVAFGIYCALDVYKGQEFFVWANQWLSGEDRSKASAIQAASTITYTARLAWATAWAEDTESIPDDSSYVEVTTRTAGYAVWCAAWAEAVKQYYGFATQPAGWGVLAAEAAARVAGVGENYLVKFAEKAMEVK